MKMAELNRLRNEDAKTDMSAEQLIRLLKLSGAYITATKTGMTNATKEYNRLVSECEHYKIDFLWVLSEAKDYFSRCPNSRYL